MGNEKLTQQRAEMNAGPRYGTNWNGDKIELHPCEHKIKPPGDLSYFKDGDEENLESFVPGWELTKDGVWRDKDGLIPDDVWDCLQKNWKKDQEMLDALKQQDSELVDNLQNLLYGMGVYVGLVENRGPLIGPDSLHKSTADYINSCRWFRKGIKNLRAFLNGSDVERFMYRIMDEELQAAMGLYEEGKPDDAIIKAYDVLEQRLCLIGKCKAPARNVNFPAWITQKFVEEDIITKIVADQVIQWRTYRNTIAKKRADKSEEEKEFVRGQCFSMIYGIQEFVLAYSLAGEFYDKVSAGRNQRRYQYGGIEY